MKIELERDDICMTWHQCPYEHTFIVFAGQDIKRPCVKRCGHDGNHVVIEPKENKPLEVWQR